MRRDNTDKKTKQNKKNKLYGAVKGSACLVCSCNLSELLPNGGAHHPRALHSILATLPSPIAQPPSLFSFSFSLSSSPLSLFFTLSRLKRVFFFFALQAIHRSHSAVVLHFKAAPLFVRKPYTLFPFTCLCSRLCVCVCELRCGRMRAAPL